MKDTKQIAETVLKIRDAEQERIMIRNRRIRRAAAAASTALVFCGVLLATRQFNSSQVEIPTISDEQAVYTETTTTISETDSITDESAATEHTTKAAFTEVTSAESPEHSTHLTEKEPLELTGNSSVETSQAESTDMNNTEAIAIQTEAAFQQTVPANDEQNGYSGALTDNKEPSTQMALITSYPSGEDSMSVPPIGNYGYSHSLYMAMEEFKDTANYLVIADVFNESGQVYNYDELAAEAVRLCNNGYTAEVETVNYQSGAYSYISLNISYEQMQSFAVRSDYGYILRLYNN